MGNSSAPLRRINLDRDHHSISTRNSSSVVSYWELVQQRSLDVAVGGDGVNWATDPFSNVGAVSAGVHSSAGDRGYRTASCTQSHEGNSRGNSAGQVASIVHSADACLTLREQTILLDRVNPEVVQDARRDLDVCSWRGVTACAVSPHSRSIPVARIEMSSTRVIEIPRLPPN